MKRLKGLYYNNRQGAMKLLKQSFATRQQITIKGVDILEPNIELLAHRLEDISAQAEYLDKLKHCDALITAKALAVYALKHLDEIETARRLAGIASAVIDTAEEQRRFPSYISL